MAPRLERSVSRGVALLGDPGRPGGVTFAFTERMGGVSEGPYASLNLGPRSGDDPAAVAENRRRALVALGVPEARLAALVSPHQVHGSHVLLVDDASPEALAKVRSQGEEGADAVVCTAPGVPVMLVFADCLPVVICAPGAFAVAHSGWRGTMRCIAGKTLLALCEAAGCEPSACVAYIGPHVTGEDYEVSRELRQRFLGRFGSMVAKQGRRLDLAQAVRSTLEGEGMAPDSILDCGLSTMRCGDRFYSWRAEAGTCGRHGALAYLPVQQEEGSARL